jgi:hypothetical protein
MDKLIVIYDESRGKILAKYVENFGRVCEVDYDVNTSKEFCSRCGAILDGDE